MSTDTATAMAWTMRNTRSPIPHGLRGEKYEEQRILTIGGIVVINVRLGNDEQGTHHVRVHTLIEDASDEAVELTEILEDSKFRMEGAPRTYKVGTGLIRQVLDLDGHRGPSDLLDSLFSLVLNGGKVAA